MGVVALGDAPPGLLPIQRFIIKKMQLLRGGKKQSRMLPQVIRQGCGATFLHPSDQKLNGRGALERQSLLEHVA